MTDKVSSSTIKKILSELWENAIFDPQTYKIVEKIAEEQKIPEKLLPDIYYELNTLRNRNLINSSQQSKLRRCVAGFFGLSVGSHAAVTWAMESRADVIKIADPDVISPSNLNRLKAGWNSVGIEKTKVVFKQIHSMNPNAHIITSTQTKTLLGIKKLFDQKPKLDIVVDEVDDLSAKVWLRRLANERNIPLISATDVGDGATIDIERYDKRPKPEPFLGRALDLDIENTDFSELPLKERVKLTMQIVGFEACSEEMLDSLLSIGKTLKTWPQLGATASIAGGIIATAIKKIILGENVESGRYYISLDKLLVKDYDSPARKTQRDEKIKEFKRKFGILR